MNDLIPKFSSRAACLGTLALLTNMASAAVDPNLAAPAGIVVVPTAYASGDAASYNPNRTISLRWDAVTGASGYEVRRFDPVTLTTTSFNVTSAAFRDGPTGLIAGRFYNYTIVTKSSGNESPATRSVWAAPSVLADNPVSAMDWSVSYPAYYYGTNRPLNAKCGNVGSPSNCVFQTPAVSAAGVYDVYLRWFPASNRSTQIPVDIESTNALRPVDKLMVKVDQTQVVPGDWALLGSFTCELDSSIKVTVRNDTGELSPFTYASADGVLLVPRRAPLLTNADGTPAAGARQFSLLRLTDDFDGTGLDTSKWSQFQGRSNHAIGREFGAATTTGDGLLHLKCTWNNSAINLATATDAQLKVESNWLEGGIISLDSQKFGYHETRMRINQLGEGVDVAFWHNAFCEYTSGYEIDSPEFVSRRRFQSTPPYSFLGYMNSHAYGIWDHLRGGRGNTHTWEGETLKSLYNIGTATFAADTYPNPQGSGLPNSVPQMSEYFTIGVEWRTDNAVTVYMNGKQVGESTAGMNLVDSILPSNAILSTKVQDWLYPTRGLHGQEALFDYTRYYQKPGWLGANNGTWQSPAHWGPDGVPGAGYAAVFNMPSTGANITLGTDQSLQSVFMDGSDLPAHTFTGNGSSARLRLGVGKPGDTSVVSGGILMNNSVSQDQTFNTNIVAVTNLQFANLSRSPSVDLLLNGTINSEGSTPRDVEFNTLLEASASTDFAALGKIVLAQPLGTGIRDVTVCGDAGLTLPSGSGHSGKTIIARGPLTITHLSALGSGINMPIILAPGYTHSIDQIKPTLNYIGITAMTSPCSKDIVIKGRAADGALKSSGAQPLLWAGDLRIEAPLYPQWGAAIPANASFALGGTNTGSNIFSGNLSAPAGVDLALTKKEAGTWILTGNINCSGILTVDKGKLQIGNGVSIGSLVVGNHIKVSSSTAELAFNHNTDFICAAPITGSYGKVTKLGSGKLTLSGNSTFSSETEVVNGTLAVTGTSGGNVTVQSGATLIGTGTLDKVTLHGVMDVDGQSITTRLQLGQTSTTLGTLRAVPAGNAPSIAPIITTQLTVYGSPKAQVDLSASDVTNAFWRLPRTFELLRAGGNHTTMLGLTVTGDSAFTTGTTTRPGAGQFVMERLYDATTDQSSWTLKWTPANLWPTALNHSATTLEGQPVTIDLLSGADAPEASQTVSVLTLNTNSVHGTVTRNGGICTYTPQPGFHGIDTFTYTVNDDYAYTGANNTVVSAPATTTRNVTVTVSETTQPTPPAAYQLTGAAIGGLSGSQRYFTLGGEPSIEIKGTGRGYQNGTNDELYYLSRDFEGNFQTVARIRELRGGVSAARLGLMLRYGVAGAPDQVFTIASPSTSSSGNYFHTSPTGSVNQIASPPIKSVNGSPWVRLLRDGDTITMAVSPDNVTYTELVRTTLTDVPINVKTGVFIASGDTTSQSEGYVTHYSTTRRDVLTGLVARWRFSESSGSTTAPDGTLTYDASFSTSGNLPGLGNALALDGGYDLVHAADKADYHGNAFSASAWVLPDNGSLSTTGRALISKRSGYLSGSAFSIFTRSGGLISVDIGDVRINTSSSLTEGIWQQVVVSFDNSKLGNERLKVYVNPVGNGSGIPVISTDLATTVNPAIPDTHAPVTIGGLNIAYNSCWKGKLDDVRLYNRAILPSEVITLFDWSE